MSNKLAYKRVLVKLSGEALAGTKKSGFDPAVVQTIARQLKDVYSAGAEIAIVIGGGNIFRGALAESLGIDRVSGDNMGMLATIINSLAVQGALEQLGIPTRVMTAIKMEEVAEPYIRRRALRHLEKGRIVIIAAGTGNPYFTTDTAASLRAIEINANILVKATRVNGVYTKDPEKFPDAERIQKISYLDVIQKQLRVMDLTAISLCMDNKLPIIVFDLFEENAILKVVTGEDIGTLIS